MMGIFKKKKQQAQPASQTQQAIPSDIGDSNFQELYQLCKPYTMTSVERLYALYSSVNYVLQNNIEGDFIECGVWKGGSAMMMAKLLVQAGITNRKIILYDTFEGMSAPTDLDKDFRGGSASELLKQQSKNDDSSIWCYSPLEEVKTNLYKTGIAEGQLILVKGKVEETIPSQLPTNKLALLRLDTDWYESTRHELIHLYPLLVQQGVLIIDDYGHWQGCRKAVDEYLKEHRISFLLNRIDETGRLAIKTF